MEKEVSMQSTVLRRRAGGVWSLVVTMALLTMACSVGLPKADAAQPAKVDPKGAHLTIQGFLQGTTMHVRAEAVGELIRKFLGYQVTVRTGAGMSGPIGTIQGKVDMLIALGPHVINKEVVQKEAPDLFPKYKETLIFPTEEKGEQLVVLDKVNCSSLAEVFAKKYPIRIGIGVTQSRLVAEKIFKTYGVSLKDIESWGGKVDVTTNPTQITEYMRDGFLDAHFIFSGLGSAYIEDLGAARKVKMYAVAQTDAELKAVQKVLPDFYRFTIPAKSYRFVDQDVPSVGFAEYLLARPDLGEEIAYNVTKAIWNNTAYLISLYPGFDKVLKKERAIQLLKIRIEDVHPGAMRYYREMKWLD